MKGSKEQIEKSNYLNSVTPEIIKMYVEDLIPLKTIAETFNTTITSIRKRLTDNNIVIRSHSENQKLVMNREEVKKNTSEASKKSSEQRVKTNIEKYGCAVASNNPEKKEEWLKKTNGVHPSQTKEVQERRQKTIEEKYGTDNIAKNDDVKKKISDNRWRNKSEEELEEIKNKSINTFKSNKEKDKDN